MKLKKEFSSLKTTIVILSIVQLMFAIGVISGTVYYRGPKQGNIYVQAYDNPDFQGSPVYWVMRNDTGSYRLGNVEDGVYWMAGYMDTDSNGIYNEPYDPSHFHDDSVVVQGDTLTGIDFMLDYYPSLNNPPLFLCFYAIKLSDSIQSAWPGTEDYLCYCQIFIYHKWGLEYIDSAYTKVPLIMEWGNRIEDDGLHWDGSAQDSVFGRYEVKDSTDMLIWLSVVDFWLLYAGVIYQPWPTGIEIVWAMPALEGFLPIPILIEPIDNDTVTTLQPDFLWNSNGADWYEVIVWDTMPMPDNCGENIIWRAATMTGNDTTLSMTGTQLEHGKYYYWALISYEDPPYSASSMEWAQFFVDTTGQGIKETSLINNQNIQLFQNYPNPFSNKTTIAYSVGRNASSAELKIYDVTGRLIKTFSLPTAYSLVPTQITWDGSDDNGSKVPSGVYFCQLKTSESTLIKQIVFLK